MVRNENIGQYSWDTSSSTVNGGSGINEWSQADAMKLLNPGYDSEPVDGSLWWNSQSGICYNGKNNATTTCDFTSTGLSDNAKNSIISVVWNIAGYNSVSVYSNQIYEYERENNVRQNPNDGITRNTTWTGKVTLMYPSDFGYATDFNMCTSTVYNYAINSACLNNNWLYSIAQNNQAQWLLSPGYSYDYGVWDFYQRPAIDYSYNARMGILPSFFLNSDVSIIDGIGTKDKPYVIE